VSIDLNIYSSSPKNYTISLSGLFPLEKLGIIGIVLPSYKYSMPLNNILSLRGYSALSFPKYEALFPV
jgi:hypothetical protein